MNQNRLFFIPNMYMYMVFQKQKILRHFNVEIGIKKLKNSYQYLFSLRIN